jgi:hypothetical protein
MSALKWVDGTDCRPGDVVQWPGCTGRQTCTAIGEDQVLIRREASVEYAAVPSDFNLLHRAGETEDRDRQAYEYQEGAPTFCGTNRTAAGWLCCGIDLGWEVFRRLRQPTPPATQPPRDVSELYQDLLYAVARCFPGESRHNTALRYIREGEDRLGDVGRRSVDPAPAKPRRMKGNTDLTPMSEHRVEHDETELCWCKPACEPVDPAPAKLRMMLRPGLMPGAEGLHEECPDCRGDIITGQGASPTWTRLAAGTQYHVLGMGAAEPACQPAAPAKFEKELTHLINRHSIENVVDMPDYLLARMLCAMIKSMGPTVKATLDWHGCDSVCHPHPNAEAHASATKETP